MLIGFGSTPHLVASRWRAWLVGRWRRLRWGIPRITPAPIGRYASLSSRFDVLLFSIIEWRALEQRSQHLARGLAARGHRVFWIDAQLRTGRRLWWDGSPFSELAAGVHGIELPAQAERVYDLDADRRVLQTMDRAVAEIRAAYAIDRAVSLVEFPAWGPLAFRLRERHGWKVVYDCLDDQREFDRRSGLQSAERFEDELVRSADLLVVTSETLHQQFGHRNPATILVRNGCDYELFRSRPASDALASMQRPIIGFAGAIADWLDFDSIEAATDGRPDWTFLFAGRETIADPVLARRWRALCARSNVRFLGQVDLVTVASLVAGFDVCTIPFRDAAITRAMNPVKMYEYLAAGKPVVATPLPEILPLADSGLIQCYSGPSDYGDQLAEALRERGGAAAIEARRTFAAGNGWARRVDQLLDATSALFETGASVD